MKYRKFGNLDWQVSQLGLGVMRLPCHEKDNSRIDEERSVEIIRYAINKGVNFIYAGYSPYEDKQRRILQTVRHALKDGYQEKIRIAITIPSLSVKTTDDFNRLLETQLGWLGLDRVDFCLLGGLNRATLPRLRELAIPAHAEKAITQGRFDKLGFHFHDYFQTLREVFDEYDNWALCGFQYSFMDIDHHPGYGGLKFAADKGLAVIITEPHLGGRLTMKPPESVSEVWKDTPQSRTQSEWALRWVWHHSEVSCAASSMSSLEQVEENAGLADAVDAGNLTIQEQILVSKVRDAYRALKPVPCTACRSCMPCIQGIDVPRIFEIYNDGVIYGDMETAREEYLTEGHRIESCTACGACVNACGRQIPILEWLDAARKRLSD